MVSFILTRAFIISAALIGAFVTVQAAPAPLVPAMSISLEDRGCRQMSCLVETAPSDGSLKSTSTIAEATHAPASTIVEATSGADIPSTTDTGVLPPSATANAALLPRSW
ncbi:hypothetical protein L227DRAFT_613342 [Lentinus tigrinus ALCF2SS1-6]|uniref:Secreted protein n=1 Tax=Lentinus tigrinus ALCF2SS1-6 TaxID=1328759 RepID=A0A5C2S3D7_9APHY|nr:hypothetical protein L227DRAFT_613342 [Lentinus tigrinus ALCF2SS1-6]